MSTITGADIAMNTSPQMKAWLNWHACTYRPQHAWHTILGYFAQPGPLASPTPHANARSMEMAPSCARSTTRRGPYALKAKTAQRRFRCIWTSRPVNSTKPQ